MTISASYSPANNIPAHNEPDYVTGIVAPTEPKTVSDFNTRIQSNPLFKQFKGLYYPERGNCSQREESGIASKALAINAMCCFAGDVRSKDPTGYRLKQLNQLVINTFPQIKLFYDDLLTNMSVLGTQKNLLESINNRISELMKKAKIIDPTFSPEYLASYAFNQSDINNVYVIQMVAKLLQLGIKYKGGDLQIFTAPEAETPLLEIGNEKVKQYLEKPLSGIRKYIKNKTVHEEQKNNLRISLECMNHFTQVAKEQLVLLDSKLTPKIKNEFNAPDHAVLALNRALLTFMATPSSTLRQNMEQTITLLQAYVALDVEVFKSDPYNTNKYDINKMDPKTNALIAATQALSNLTQQTT